VVPAAADAKLLKNPLTPLNAFSIVVPKLFKNGNLDTIQVTAFRIPEIADPPQVDILPAIDLNIFANFGKF
jgi:hypothetical protein